MASRALWHWLPWSDRLKEVSDGGEEGIGRWAWWTASPEAAVGSSSLREGVRRRLLCCLLATCTFPCFSYSHTEAYIPLHFWKGRKRKYWLPSRDKIYAYIYIYISKGRSRSVSFLNFLLLYFSVPPPLRNQTKWKTSVHSTRWKDATEQYIFPWKKMRGGSREEEENCECHDVSFSFFFLAVAFARLKCKYKICLHHMKWPLSASGTQLGREREKMKNN